MFQEFISVTVALKSMGGRKFSYKLGLNKHEQFLHGTHKLHSISKDTLRICSFSTITRENCATKLPAVGDLELEEVSGFVTCSYNSQWWLGCVLETHQRSTDILDFASSTQSFSFIP